MAFFTLPGIQSFARLRKSGSYYVDKTGFLENFLMPYPMDVTLFTRPRRFGKTLFMSMLAEFFDITKDSHELFEGLAVAANKDLCAQWMNKYPVIFLSLKDVDKPTYTRALTDFQDIIAVYCTGHKYLLSSDKVEPADKVLLKKFIDRAADEDTLWRSLKTLIRVQTAHHGKPVIVLIDEYDAPVAKAADNGYYNEMIKFIRGFFSFGLKTNADDLMFGILTGCLHITRESIFSGLNHLDCNDIMSDSSYVEVFGFTQDEVDRVLNDAGFSGKRDLVKAWYDGYRFGDQTEIYCPWSIMKYLKELETKPNKEPQAYWQNTSENALVKSLFPGSSPEMTQDIADFIAGSCLVREISINPTFESLDSTPTNLRTLLYMSGYLTRASNEIVEAQGVSQNFENNKLPLVIPNREIRDIFKYEVRNWFRESVSEAQQNDFFTAFWNVDTEGVKKELEAILLEKVSSQDLAKDSPKSPRENFYHGLLIGYFLVVYPKTFSNLQAGTGQYDIRVLDDTDNTNKKAAIVEVKRATKEGEDLAKLAEDGLAQIRERKYDVRLLSDPKVTTVLHWSIAFFKKSCAARAIVVRQP